jgi:tartrate-resistant acid phosphatase type 5
MEDKEMLGTQAGPLVGLAQEVATGSSGPCHPGAGEAVSVKFACIGDWGSRTPALNAVAKHMTDTVDNIDFVVALGDNFYSSGVKSTDDLHWYHVFEEPFMGVDRPWYPILGNHDWDGDPFAQLAYSRLNPKWKMHSLSYKHSFGNGLLDMFFLDTTTLCPRESNGLTMKGFEDRVCEPQYEWLEQQLRVSTARWKIVCGHYPVYSNGENGSTSELQRLEGMMQHYQVDTYISAHDHSMQHLFNNESGIHYFVAGSGSSSRFFMNSLRALQTMQAETVWKSLDKGYLHCTVGPESVKFDYINTTGKSSYEYILQKVVTTPLKAELRNETVVDATDSNHVLANDFVSDECGSAPAVAVTIDDVVFAFVNQPDSIPVNTPATSASEE